MFPSCLPISLLFLLVMADPVQVPNLSLVHLFRDILEQEYTKAKKELGDLDPETQGTFTRRLAAICNSISEALIRSTAQMHSSYKGKSGSFQQVPRLGKDAKEPVDQEKQVESRKVQAQLARAIALFRTQFQEETERLVAQVKAARNVHIPEDSAPQMPDLARELTAYTRSVAYERDLKAKAVSVLQQAKLGVEVVAAHPTAFEARVYSQFLWSP